MTQLVSIPAGRILGFRPGSVLPDWRKQCIFAKPSSPCGRMGDQFLKPSSSPSRLMAGMRCRNEFPWVCATRRWPAKSGCTQASAFVLMGVREAVLACEVGSRSSFRVPMGVRYAVLAREVASHSSLPGAARTSGASSSRRDALSGGRVSRSEKGSGGLLPVRLLRSGGFLARDHQPPKRRLPPRAEGNRRRNQRRSGGQWRSRPVPAALSAAGVAYNDDCGVERGLLTM